MNKFVSDWLNHLGRDQIHYMSIVMNADPLLPWQCSHAENKIVSKCFNYNNWRRVLPYEPCYVVYKINKNNIHLTDTKF